MPCQLSLNFVPLRAIATARPLGGYSGFSGVPWLHPIKLSQPESFPLTLLRLRSKKTHQIHQIHQAVTAATRLTIADNDPAYFNNG
jgi:hypothetical protein